MRPCISVIRPFTTRHNNIIHLVLACLLTLSPGLVNAKLYKWVDENGNTHFSDTKPGDNALTSVSPPGKSTTSHHPKDFLGTHYAEKKKPVANTRGRPVRAVELTSITLDYETLLPQRKKTRIGNQRIGNVCEKPGNRDYYLRDWESKWLNSEFRRSFPLIMQQNGYTAYASKADINDAGLKQPPELQLSATILGLQVNSCFKPVFKRKKLQVSSFYHVRWQLYDNRRKTVIYTTETKGYDIGLYARYSGAIRRPDESISNRNSINVLIGNLLADKQFVAILTQHSNAATAVPKPVNTRTRDIKDFLGTSIAKKKTPVRIPASQTIRPIELVRFTVDTETLFPQQTNGGIGKRYRGKFCDRPRKRYYRLTQQAVNWITSELYTATSSILKKRGYISPVSNFRNNASPLHLSVKILDVQTNSCEKKVLNNKKLEVSSFYRARWKLYDPQSETVVYSTETTGYNKILLNRYSGTLWRNDENISNANSIKMAIHNLLADKRFVDKVLAK